ncbi:osmotically inducible lipoprotein OsmB [Paraburkholderia unamae]|uniref:glycine zipper 2TM domain-containing protein n=1 Tax=Paraburkholderia unamae TaxID=219649 RepID=UPI000DC36F70|nr:glycine zipper 2TM domain-containing protein [Paraburkholderia unamae]RAR65007.1 osmotically inducible lipoprotein OsmB [Paraburkholderia unamae]
MNWLRRIGAARASLVATVILTTLGAGACTLGGAAAGGYVGNRATNGSAVGTVGGAVAGGVIGHELSK